MEEGIAIAQRSTYVIFDVEFTEGEEPGIPDDEANSPISECIFTVFLSCRVPELIQQGVLIRGKKLSQILLDDDLLHDGSSGGGGG